MEGVVPLAHISSDVSVEKRREQLIARLDGRHLANREKESAKLGKLAKDRQKEVDLLISRATFEYERGVASESTMDQLENAMQSLESGRASKRIQSMLDDLRRITISNKKNVNNISGFSFVKKPTPIRASSASAGSDKLIKPVSLNSLNDIVKDNCVILEDKFNETLCLTGSDESSLKLKDLKDCVVCIAFRPSAVHVQDISNCKLVFLPVETSILMFNVNRTSIWASAQQIRVHDSTSVDFHVSVRGAIILEGCRAIRLAPYRVICNGEEIVADGGTQWRKPSDFDWLSEGQSPNWSIMEENEWISGEIKYVI